MLCRYGYIFAFLLHFYLIFSIRYLLFSQIFLFRSHLTQPHQPNMCTTGTTHSRLSNTRMAPTWFRNRSPNRRTARHCRNKPSDAQTCPRCPYYQMRIAAVATSRKSILKFHSFPNKLVKPSVTSFIVFPILFHLQFQLSFCFKIFILTRFSYKILVYKATS